MVYRLDTSFPSPGILQPFRLLFSRLKSLHFLFLSTFLLGLLKQKQGMIRKSWFLCTPCDNNPSSVLIIAYLWHLWFGFQFGSFLFKICFTFKLLCPCLEVLLQIILFIWNWYSQLIKTDYKDGMEEFIEESHTL